MVCWKSGQTGKKPKIGVRTKHPKFRTFLNRPLREMSGVLSYLPSRGSDLDSRRHLWVQRVFNGQLQLVLCECSPWPICPSRHSAESALPTGAEEKASVKKNAVVSVSSNRPAHPLTTAVHHTNPLPIYQHVHLHSSHQNFDHR